MRILTVSAFYETHGGGIEIVAAATARALARLGHECRWAAAGFDAAPADTGLQPVPLAASDPLERWTGLPMPLPTRAACRQLEQEIAAADGVIVHDALYVSSLLAARYATKHRKPWILIQHIGAIPFTNPLLRLAISAANRLVTRALFASAPQAVFISDAVRAQFAGTKWKRPPALLFNGVDHETFNMTAPEKRTDLRKRLGLADDRRQLLFVGRFVEKKGLAVIRSMAGTNPEWDFHLVGSGSIDPAAWQLPNVRLLGRKNRNELAQLYQAADALLLPSVGEGFPLVIQEAMACGLPVFCGPDSAEADPAAHRSLHAVEVDPRDATATARRFAAAVEGVPLVPDTSLAAHARLAYDWDANARWLETTLGALQSASTEQPTTYLRFARSPFGSSQEPSAQQP